MQADIGNLPIHPTHTCFDDALDYLESLAKRHSPDLMEHRLVHAACLMPDGREYAHAWVEHGDEAIGAGLIDAEDLIRGSTERLRVYYFASRRDFYRHFRPVMMTKYTPFEAYQENKRTRHFGPWESYYRELITQK